MQIHEDHFVATFLANSHVQPTEVQAMFIRMEETITDAMAGARINVTRTPRNYYEREYDTHSVRSGPRDQLSDDHWRDGHRDLDPAEKAVYLEGFFEELCHAM